MSRYNIEYWLAEQDNPPGQPNPGVPPLPQPAAQPQAPQQPPAPAADDNAGKPKQDDLPDDITNDPQSPDMPDFYDGSKDFETWKNDFMELSIKGDPNEMIDSINQVRDRKLDGVERRFVEDNTEVLLLRQDANYDRASKEIRRLISQELDRNNPSVSIVQHMTNTLESYPVLHNVFIKLAGRGAQKADLHRKHIAALLGAVVVGGGGDKQDLLYAARDYSVNISTRITTQFGDVTVGPWTLQEDDPDRYLTESELDRLSDGSPEEKRVLRRRVILESISNKYRNRAFIINVIDPLEGTVHFYGWDMSEGLKAGYKEGKLVVRKKKSQFRDAQIDDNGAIIPLFDYAINYNKEKGELDERGSGKNQELPFMERRDGNLSLTAQLNILQELSAGMPGAVLVSTPYQGNPSDLPGILRCAPSIVETLMRRC